MNFKDIDLHKTLLQGLEKAKYKEATPVQEAVLMQALKGKDLYVQSQTGTGKTAAFLIPMIQSLISNETKNGKKALILVPTRELAVQVEKEASILTSFSRLKTASFYGGVGYDRQIAALKKGVDILVGTPGRLLDLEKSQGMNLKDIAFLVVDEADRMFDMGFYPDLRKIIKLLPDAKQRQTMLFSATLNSYVKNLAWEYTIDAKEITIDADSITLDEIEQKLFHVSSDNKMELLLGTLKNEKPQSTIIFCNTKKSCEIVSKRLSLNKVENEFIMGDLVQSKRLKIIESLKNGSLSILIATDVAARGIDINDLELVINYDLPNESENYVHRIGRTARAGKKGKAYSFCSEQDVYNLPAIEKYLEKTIPSELADEKLFLVDESKGIYIRLDADENYEQKNHKSFSQPRNRSQTKLQNKRYPSKRTPRDKTQRYNKTAREEFTKDLGSLSFDERMKLYKDKYGQSGSVQRNKNYPNPKTLHKSYDKNKSFDKNKKPQTEIKKTETKKGLVSSFFSIFKKK